MEKQPKQKAPGYMNIKTRYSLFMPLMLASWDQTNQAIIYGGDIRRPWKSVYGFSMIAARLLEQEKRLLTADEVNELVKYGQDILVEPDRQTVVTRLIVILSPNNPMKEITGLRAMLRRSRVMIAALERVKERGFLKALNAVWAKIWEQPVSRACLERSASGRTKKIAVADQT